MKLQAPVGLVSFTHRDHSYSVDNDGTVEVPDNVSMDELTAHGFTKYVEPESPQKSGKR